VQDDIVWQLRSMDDRRLLPSFHHRTVVCTAAYEIQRLRRNTGCARNQRSTQFCAEALDAQRDVARLTAERDEARQMFCNAMTDHCEEDEARQIAREQGWDCFKDKAGSSSTAPTPANTGGGAENQIPEAL